MHDRSTALCAAITTLLLALAGNACALDQAASDPGIVKAEQAFAGVADEFFDGFYFPTNPTTATQTGIHAYDSKLEDYSRAGVDRQVQALQGFDKRVTAIDPKALDETTRGDRDLVLNYIHGSLLTLQTIRPWEKNPDTYSSGITNCAFAIMERKFAPLPERLHALIEREKLMPAALQAARGNLKNPPHIYTEIALEQLPGLISFFRHDVPSVFSEVGEVELKKQFAASNGAVLKALGDYQTWLKTDILPNSDGDFRLGADTYRKKLLFDEMVDTPLDALIAIDMKNLQRNQAEFARVAKEIDPEKTPQQVLAELAADHPGPAKLLDAFRATFDGLTRFIREKRIITIPSDVRPILEETPPFMRATTFASMDNQDPMKPSRRKLTSTSPCPTRNGTRRARTNSWPSSIIR
ncbi:MAG: DUF885 family protein [Rudaea sp.]|nr:DUF885 family protein [Rudaea sp.]